MSDLSKKIDDPHFRKIIDGNLTKIDSDESEPSVDVSLDACHPWTLEVIRSNAKWNTLLSNLQFVGELKKAGTISKFDLNTTIQMDNFHEMADMVRLGRTLGCNGVRFYLIQDTEAHLNGPFPRMNVAHHGHPLHMAFLETLRDPIFEDPITCLDDVGMILDTAKEQPLPSDLIDGIETEAVCVEMINTFVHQNRLTEAAALAAYGRIHFPDSYDIKFLDGAVLQMMGFPLQASYRFRELCQEHGDNPHPRLSLGTTLFEVGRHEEAIHEFIEACLHAPDHPEIHEVVAKFLSANMGPRTPAEQKAA